MMTIGFVVFKVLPAVGGISGLKRARLALFSKLRMKEDATLTAKQYQMLAVGTAYAEQQSAYLNALETGMETTHLNTVLSDWWSIDDPQEAVDTLNKLRDKGDRFYLPAVQDAAKRDEHDPEPFFANLYQNDSPQDIEKSLRQLNNLYESINTLTEHHIVSGLDHVTRVGVEGWDAGRLVFITRLCHEAGYINETQAWDYIQNAHALAADAFDDWEAFSKSYILGRALWGGEQCANDGMIGIVEYLLNDPKSPWANMALK